MTFNRKPLPRENATRACSKMGKSLIEISSQKENDIISELLLGVGINSTGLLSSIWIKTPAIEDILGKLCQTDDCI